MSYVLDGQALAHLLRSPDGMVGRAILDGATRVELGARDQVGKDTRDLERSIVKRPMLTATEFTVRVGSPLSYALIHHEGRGPVIAAPGKVLRFKVGGQVLFRHSVGPAKPNHFLTDQLPRALP
jgi:hypothetical protein